MVYKKVRVGTRGKASQYKTLLSTPGTRGSIAILIQKLRFLLKKPPWQAAKSVACSLSVSKLRYNSSVILPIEEESTRFYFLRKTGYRLILLLANEIRSIRVGGSN